MSRYMDSDRQLSLLMMMISEMKPGSVCLNTKCLTREVVPHMANDGGNHPHPYGVISTPTHEWRRISRSRRICRKVLHLH
jgi:hypothetical protein